MISMVTNISDTFQAAYKSFVEVPTYHLCLEAFMFMWVLWFVVSKKKKHVDGQIILTPEEEDQIIRAWQPKPLVDVEPGEEETAPLEIWGTVEGRPGKHIVVDGVKYLNLATHNYLGLVDEPALDKEAERCIRKYGVGSCGPRGFYGTVDVHLELEEKIAKFLNLEETALYSFGFSTIASAIPSYSKAGDMIFADEHVNFSIQKGLQASRSIIHYFKHNDVEDLERLLDVQAQVDLKNPKKAKTIRRFCLVEGIYSKTGEMCPLKDVAQLCKRHKVRLFVDESISFGAIGATGRGVTEYLDVPREDIDLICGSLENGLAAFGGFIVGPSFVVDHQRISGLGYCFSASLPPLLAGVGIQSLKMIEENPEMVAELQDNCRYMHLILSHLPLFEVSGHELSPVKHIYFRTINEDKDITREQAKLLYNLIIKEVKKNHKIALIQPSYLEKQESSLPPPSIRITVNRLLTKEEMNDAVLAINDACITMPEQFVDPHLRKATKAKGPVDLADMELEPLQMPIEYDALLKEHQIAFAKLDKAVREYDSAKRKHENVIRDHVSMIREHEDAVRKYECEVRKLDSLVQIYKERNAQEPKKKKRKSGGASHKFLSSHKSIGHNPSS